MKILFLIAIVYFLSCCSYYIYRVIKKKMDKKTMLVFLSGLLPLFAIYVYSVNQPSDLTRKEDNRSSFYELDKIVDESEIGTKTIDYEAYQSFTENVLTLEGAVYSYGVPTNVIGAEKGDKYMEVIYPSNEYGNSIGLKFEYSPSSLGNWKLTEKYVVKTEGVSIPEYEMK
ncbi:hypothetical protein [Vagococcus fluvialis]|uniref:hypothetical protein n=1 Tax=Vagococcus fluvialis TaxID=2738 RepID=UPI001D09F061|nr:hypothetical protein [Vagococcus fluvialis]UDM79558.1 hypothetical protein K5K97_12815 [Vagococcus fluvialis]